MTGRYLDSNSINMALGSSSLTRATCSPATQGCCDGSFGKMIGGMSKNSFLNIFSLLLSFPFLYFILMLF